MSNDQIFLWFIIGSVIVVLFTIAVAMFAHFKYVIFSDYARIVFTAPDKRTFTIWKRLKLTESSFDLRLDGVDQKFVIDRNRIYRSGRFRVPTMFYTVGNDTPVDQLQTGQESQSSIEFAQVAKNTVTRDLLSAFDTSILSPQNMFILGLLVTVGAAVILGFFVNLKSDEILKKLEPETTFTSPRAIDE